MQRAPCSCSSSTGSVCWYSRKSWTRSATGRLGPPARSILRKAPSSPIFASHVPVRVGRRRHSGDGGLVLVTLLVALVRARRALEVRDVVRAPGGAVGQRPRVVGGHDLHPAADQRVPLAEHTGGHLAAGALAVLLHERADLLEVLGA